MKVGYFYFPSSIRRHITRDVEDRWQIVEDYIPSSVEDYRLAILVSELVRIVLLDLLTTLPACTQSTEFLSCRGAFVLDVNTRLCSSTSVVVATIALLVDRFGIEFDLDRSWTRTSSTETPDLEAQFDGNLGEQGEFLTL